MNKYTEQQIKDKLDQLANIRPAEETIRQANQKIRAMLTNRKQSLPLLYSILSTAAMLLIGLSLFFPTTPTTTLEYQPVNQDDAALTRIQLNQTFSAGGEKALDERLEKAWSKRDAQPETITLQHLLQEL